MAFGKKEAGARAAAASGEKRAKRAKKPLSPKEKKRRILLVVLALAAAVLCATAAAVAFFQRPELPDPVTKEEEFGELTGPKLSGDRKEDFFYLSGDRPRHRRRRQHRYRAPGSL